MFVAANQLQIIAVGFSIGWTCGKSATFGTDYGDVAGAAVGLSAMAASDLPIALTGVSDPATWSSTDWLSDLIPHLVYGLVTVAVYDALRGTSRAT